MSTTIASQTASAALLFPPIARNYDRWSDVLSLGQDPRWRRALVDRMAVPPAGRVLDVAAGTGLITRLLEEGGHSPVALDLSLGMLRNARRPGTPAVLGAADALPFPDEAFDALTFGYLLRYVPDPLATMRELTRVVRPGGAIGMVEFARPRGFWRPWWWLYTRIGLPAAGLVLAGPAWFRVGRFLGPSIDDFVRRFSDEEMIDLWRAAGLRDVRLERRSLGGGVIVRAQKA